MYGGGAGVVVVEIYQRALSYNRSVLCPVNPPKARSSLSALFLYILKQQSVVVFLFQLISVRSKSQSQFSSLV